MPQRTIRFSDNNEETDRGRSQAWRVRLPDGFHSVQQRLSARPSQGDGAEERLGANLEQLRRELMRPSRAEQALFAYLDALGLH